MLSRIQKPGYSAGGNGNVKWHNHSGKQFSIFFKQTNKHTKNETSNFQDLGIVVLEIY